MYKLKLYIVNKTKRTKNTIDNLHEIIQSELMNEYTLEVIDVIDTPTLAYQDNILAAVKKLRQAKTFKTNCRNTHQSYRI